MEFFVKESNIDNHDHKLRDAGDQCGNSGPGSTHLRRTEMSVDQDIVQHPVDAQGGQRIHKAHPGRFRTPQHPQQYLCAGKEEVGEADDPHVLGAFRNHMWLVRQDAQCCGRKEEYENKHHTRQSQCHPQGYLGGFFDAVDVLFAPEPGGENDGAIAGTADEHLQQELDLVHQCHPLQGQFGVSADHDIVQQIYPVDDDVLQGNDDQHPPEPFFEIFPLGKERFFGQCGFHM